MLIFCINIAMIIGIITICICIIFCRQCTLAQPVKLYRSCQHSVSKGVTWGQCSGQLGLQRPSSGPPWSMKILDISKVTSMASLSQRLWHIHYLLGCSATAFLHDAHLSCQRAPFMAFVHFMFEKFIQTFVLILFWAAWCNFLAACDQLLVDFASILHRYASSTVMAMVYCSTADCCTADCSHDCNHLMGVRPVIREFCCFAETANCFN